MVGSILLLAGGFSLTGCPATTLKEIIEDKFPDFTGLETALKREYIVGLQPDQDFPNLHCCWVGDRTGWKKIAGSWSTEEKTTVDASVLALLKAFSIDLSVKSVTYVEAKAEPFYRDQLVNIRHLPQDHCSKHWEFPCARKICTNALKVGKVSVSTYTKINGGISTPKLKELTTVKLKGDSYVKDEMSAENIIVGYKMEPTVCGQQVWFGDKRTPSAGLSVVKSGGGTRIETYQDHQYRFEKDLEKRSEAQSYLPNRPAAQPTIHAAPGTEPVAVLGPPPGNVIAGQVIRVTAVDQDYSPNIPLQGLVVSETDDQGETSSREVQTDAEGGAWILVGTTARSISIAVDEKPVYSSPAREPTTAPQGPPVIDVVKPYQSEGPEGMVESRSLAEITGKDFGSVTEILVDGEPQTPLAAGSDYAVGRLDGEGVTQLEITNSRGFASPTIEVVLIKIIPEKVPPPVLQSGQAAEVVLRIEGTTQSVRIGFTIESQSIRFADGSVKLVASSSGGLSNTVRIGIRAQQAGPYTINYRLADQEN